MNTEIIILKNKYFLDACNSAGTEISILSHLIFMQLLNLGTVIHLTEMRKMSLTQVPRYRVQSQALNSERWVLTAKAKLSDPSVLLIGVW